MRLQLCFIAIGFVACTQADLSQQLNTSLCSDDFNRSDAFSYGSNWELNGLSSVQLSYGITSQAAYASLTAPGWGFLSCATKIQQSRTIISAKIKLSNALTGTAGTGIVARSQAKDTISDAYYCGLEAGKLILYKGVNVLRTNLASSAGTYNANTEYTLTFSLIDNQLTCSVSGAATDSVSATDSSFSSGYTGMFMLVASNLRIDFDDFKTEAKP